MKLLIIDPVGTALSFAWRSATAGHAVKWFTKAAHGSGFKGVEKVENWAASVMWADLVFVANSAGIAERLDFFKAKGAAIVCGPSKSEFDLGMRTAFTRCCASSAEAEGFVKSDGRNYFVNGEYMPHSKADLVAWLRSREGAVTLTEQADGVAVKVSRWFGANGWVGQWNESLGHVSAFTSASKLGALFDRLDGQLVGTGQVSFDVSVASDGGLTCYGASFGPIWPLFNMTLAANKGDPAKWLLDAVNGSDSTAFVEEVCASRGIMAGTQKAPIYGVVKPNKKYLHPEAVNVGQHPASDWDDIIDRQVWEVAGRRCMTATGFGRNVEQAEARATKTARQLYARGAVLSENDGLAADLAALHAHGYATNINYESRVK